MDVHLVKTIKNLANKDGALQNVWQVSTNMDAAQETYFLRDSL